MYKASATLIMLLGTMFSVPVLATQTTYCGVLAHLKLESKEIAVEKMNLVNSNNNPKHLVVESKQALEAVIRVITDNSKYNHRSSEDDFYWESNASSDRYFICVTGEDPEQREDDYYYMSNTYGGTHVWKNSEGPFNAELSIGQ